MLAGIDVSNVNGTVAWERVAGSGVTFGWAKCSEGDSFIDPRTKFNRGGAAVVGIHLGLYHFARPDHHAGVSGAQAEARFFASLIGKVQPGELAPALDLETLGPGSMTVWAGAFLVELQRLVGVRPVLYTYTAFAEAHLSLKALAYPLWLADYGANDGRAHPAGLPYDVHQYTSVGRCAGVDGNVDLNAATSLEKLLVAAPKPAPAPVTVPQGEPKNEAPFKRLWPVPIPAWFWTWAQWRRDGQTYARPLDAPTVIPPWAWLRLRQL